jgi:hypothetical protein
MVRSHAAADVLNDEMNHIGGRGIVLVFVIWVYRRVNAFLSFALKLKSSPVHSERTKEDAS